MNAQSFNSEEDSFDSTLDDGIDNEIVHIKEKKTLDRNLIFSISTSLSNFIEENQRLPNIENIVRTQNKIPFYLENEPDISLYDYILRIQTYCSFEDNTLIAAYIYIHRICQKGNIILTNNIIHSILIGAILISIKYNEDDFFNNNFFSEIVGIEPKELRDIEYAFLELCEFEMYISSDLFEKYKRNLTSFEK